jgi:hypothetical protein
MLSKLKYGLVRLRDELTGKEDYWHIRFMARELSDIQELQYYYLDLHKKSEYPFELKGLIPVVTINDRKLELPVTILNYGLGWLDRYPEGGDAAILAVYKWLKENQQPNGAWLQNFDDATYKLESGWVSGMTQGLAISFLIRCVKRGLVERHEVEEILQLALDCMLSDLCKGTTDFGPFIEEYGGTNSHVLNGFVFSLYGLYDYSIYKNDASHFELYESTLAALISRYNFSGWTYYDANKLIASRLYHNLHVEMMKSLFLLTNRKVYKKYYQKWKRGDYLFFIFVLIKAAQKMLGLSKMDTLDT